MDRPKPKVKTMTPLRAIGKVRWSDAAYGVMQSLPKETNLLVRQHIRDLSMAIAQQEGAKRVLASHVIDARNAMLGEANVVSVGIDTGKRGAEENRPKEIR